LHRDAPFDLEDASFFFPDGPAAAQIARELGVPLAIKAQAQPSDARLALAGTGEEETRLRQLLAELGLSGRVHFLGLVSHDLLPVLLSAADAMVLPSASEGLSNAYVEALACGTPIVIPDIGGARDPGATAAP
jgi:teichuronic acid biosynthesis glycosyltransferase TuaC